MRTPPGRAGRLWIAERLAVARRGEDVLEQKARKLQDEERRLRRLVADTSAHWEEAARVAHAWHLRAGLLGGERQHALAAATAPAPAEVTVRWRAAMGVAYPAEASCRTPDPRRVAGVGRTAAFIFAAEAHAAALEAAVDHAAATRALEVVANELETTRRRARAVRDRWIPLLTARAHELELDLAEAEREEIARASWVLSEQGDREPGGREQGDRR